MSDSPLPQPLEEFLQAPPSAELAPPLRAAMLADTTGLLPKRRGRGRWVMMPAVAASIAAAFVAGYLLGRSHEAEHSPLPEQAPVESALGPAPKQPTDFAQEKPQPPAVTAKALTALDLEWQAFDTTDDEKRAQLYFQAGDLYFSKDRDVSGAARCYRHALAYCNNKQLEFDATDNWLVMALKRDQRMEK